VGLRGWDGGIARGKVVEVKKRVLLTLGGNPGKKFREQSKASRYS
jgi:hypothetical protein